MKRLIIPISIISVMINVGLVYLFFIRGENAQLAEDNRTTITISVENKEIVLSEMRSFLESVKLINEGIVEDNPEKIILAGKKSGGSAVHHAPKGLLRKLPIGFKSLGFSTHDMFDKIAEDAKERFDKRQAQQQLNTLLNNCVSCHAAYKLEVPVKNEQSINKFQ